MVKIERFIKTGTLLRRHGCPGVVGLVKRDPAWQAIREAGRSIGGEAAKNVKAALRDIYNSIGSDAAITAAVIVKEAEGQASRPNLEQVLQAAELVRIPEARELLGKLVKEQYGTGQAAETAVNLAGFQNEGPEYLAGAITAMEPYDSFAAQWISKGLLKTIQEVGGAFPDRKKAFAGMLFGIKAADAANLGSEIESLMKYIGNDGFGRMLALAEQQPSRAAANIFAAFYDYFVREWYRHTVEVQLGGRTGINFSLKRDITLEDAVGEAVSLLSMPGVGSLFSEGDAENAPFAFINLVKIGQLGTDAVRTASEAASMYKGDFRRYVLEALATSEDASSVVKRAGIMKLPEVTDLLNESPAEYWPGVLEMGQVSLFGPEAAKATVRLVRSYGTFEALISMATAKSEEQALNAAQVMLPQEVSTTITQTYGIGGVRRVFEAVLTQPDKKGMGGVVERVTLPELVSVVSQYKKDPGTERAIPEILHFAANYLRDAEEAGRLATVLSTPETVRLAATAPSYTPNTVNNLLNIFINRGAEAAISYARSSTGAK